MKVLINDVKKEFEHIKEIETLTQLKELIIKFDLSLIEAHDKEHISKLQPDVQKYLNERFKGCELILTEHNDYIE